MSCFLAYNISPFVCAMQEVHTGKISQILIGTGSVGVISVLALLRILLGGESRQATTWVYVARTIQPACQVLNAVLELNLRGCTPRPRPIDDLDTAVLSGSTALFWNSLIHVVCA